jgi:hypothetical protein
MLSFLELLLVFDIVLYSIMHSPPWAIAGFPYNLHLKRNEEFQKYENRSSRKTNKNKINFSL